MLGDETTSRKHMIAEVPLRINFLTLRLYNLVQELTDFNVWRDTDAKRTSYDLVY